MAWPNCRLADNTDRFVRGCSGVGCVKHGTFQPQGVGGGGKGSQFGRFQAEPGAPFLGAHRRGRGKNSTVRLYTAV